MYLAEKAAAGARIPVTEVLVDLSANEQNSPEHGTRNFFRTVPVLELDDGTRLIESLTAMEYLEELYPTPPMVGSTPLERALVRQLERIAETRVLNPLAQFVHETRSPRDLPPSPEIAEWSHRNLQKGLTHFNTLLADGRVFVSGLQPSIADCTLAAALNFTRACGFERDPYLTHITRWITGYRTRPAVLEVLGI